MFSCELCEIFENNLFYRIPLVAASRVNRRCPLWKLLEACNFIKKEATKELENQSSKVFYKKDVLKNFTKFTEKHLCQTFFTTFLKKRLWRRCFPVNLMKFSRTPSFIEHVRWLLLEFTNIFETLQLGLTFFIVTFFSFYRNWWIESHHATFSTIIFDLDFKEVVRYWCFTEKLLSTFLRQSEINELIFICQYFYCFNFSIFVHILNTYYVFYQYTIKHGKKY